MKKVVQATLSCVLLLPGATAVAVETSLLDRLAQEKIIGDEQLHPRVLPVPIPSVSSRPAESRADEGGVENAQIAGQLREVHERVMALQKRIADMERSSARPKRQPVQAKKAPQAAPSSGMQSQAQERDMAKIRDLSKQLADAVKQRKALTAELSDMKAAADNTKSDGLALSAAQAEIGSLKKQTAELQAANQQLITKSKSDSGALSIDLSAARTEISSLQRRAAELQAANEQLINKSKSDGGAFNTELNSARAEIAYLKKQATELQTAKQQLINQTKSDSGTLSADLNTARTEIAGLKKQTAELQTENQQLISKSKSDSGTLSTDLTAARSEIANLKKQVVELQATNQKLAASSTSDNGTLVADLNASKTEIASLKKRAAELQVDNQQLIEKSKFDIGVFNADLKDAKAEIANLKKQAAERQAGKGVVIDNAVSKDVRTSYAVGAWYAETAAMETQKLTAIGKKLDMQAFSQGFNDKLGNRLQLSQEKLAAEINDAQKQLKVAMQSTSKQSKALMDTAAKEKGAVKMPDGVVYRVVDKGKAPIVTDKQEVVFDISEQLSTGEELNRETQTRRVQELSPLFQTIFTQLGVGGTAKIFTPVTQAHADAMGLPTGTVSIITVKLSAIK